MNTENNKVIREFYPKMKVDNGIGELTEVENLRVGCLCYHSDWNWLMQVVEKIESLEDLERFEITTFNVSIQYYETREKRFDYNLYFSTIELNSKVIPKIEAVYNACVEFIKWYNNQK